MAGTLSYPPRCRVDQHSALPIGNMPAALSACELPEGAAAAAGYGEGGRCGAAGISLKQVPGASTSKSMSDQLLKVGFVSLYRIPMPPSVGCRAAVHALGIGGSAEWV